MGYTLTYSDSAKGWQSFYSFEPDMMIGMNNRFYSAKGGKLYIHNSDNVNRNNFYGTQYTSKITGFINDAPSTVKTFKTIVLDSNSAWDCNVYSDLGSGNIQAEWFSLKEGNYYGHIRRNEDDGVLELRSVQGMGNVSSVNSDTPSATILTFTFDLGSMISLTDKVYKESGGNISLVGSITSINKADKTITVDTTVAGGSIPTANQFLLYIKNNIAESYGTTGYYLKYELESSSTSFAEIFGIGTNLFRSLP
jgi:hypothetical protein